MIVIRIDLITKDHAQICVEYGIFSKKQVTIFKLEYLTWWEFETLGM